MSYRLNEKIANLKPYDPISGEYKIRLDANESYIKVPDEVLDKAFDLCKRSGLNRYPDPCCTELIKAYAEFFGLSDKCLTMSNGSDEMISIIVSSFLLKGEKMVTVLPDFSMYAFYASVFENTVVPFYKKDDFSFDVTELIDFVNKNEAKLLIFSNPCNPTGYGIKRDEVELLLKSTDALVVVDEAYMDFWDQSVMDLIGTYDNLIVLKTFSKAFGFAGVRLGAAIANEKLTNVLRAVKSPYNVNVITQTAALCLLEKKDYIYSAFEQLKNSVKGLYNALKELENDFTGRFYIAPTCTNFIVLKSDEAKELYEYLLSCSIAVRYMGSFLRITTGTPEENAELISCIKAYFNK